MIVLSLLLGVALCTGLAITVMWLLDVVERLLRRPKGSAEEWLAWGFFGACAAGAVVPPVAILWMAIA